MPNIFIKLPNGVFDPAARDRLAQAVTAAAMAAEQIGDDPQHALTTWVVIEELEPSHLYVGGGDPLGRFIPVIVFFHPPAGVIDESGRAELVKLMHEAVTGAKPAGDSRPVMTNIIVADVADGTWGVSGQVWRLPEMARAAGYKHLQHLVV
jgi:phenylpyruvate tautomerase PptA (4-oxalocrotonate tautomerase family)